MFKTWQPVYRWCPERLTKQAFRVRGRASFGLVSRSVASVAQVPPVLLGGTCFPCVPNVFARWLRPSLSTIVWRPCQHRPISSLPRPGFVSTQIQDRFERSGSLPVGRPPPCNHPSSPGCS